MKKRIIALLLLVALVFAMASCQKGSAEYSVSLADQPIMEDQIFKTSGEMTIRFELPQAGYLKLMAYDATDYKKEPAEYPSASVSYSNEAGYVAYKSLNIDNGYLNKCRFEKGVTIAKITFDGAKKMKKAGLYWVFAPDIDTPAPLTADQPAAKAADGAKEARFSLSVKKPTLYNIHCSEAAVWESDCSFEVYNAKGQTVAGNLAIHGTEWTSRKIFLKAGEYEIVAREIEGVATMMPEVMGEYDQITLAGSPAPTLPATIGFCGDLAQTQSATFVLDGSKPELWASASGAGEYYDSSQRFTMVVRDAMGNEIAREEVDGTTMINLKGRTGTHTVEISNAGNGIVYLNLDEI